LTFRGTFDAFPRLASYKSNVCTTGLLVPRLLLVYADIRVHVESRNPGRMYEAHGIVYQTKADAIHEAQIIANLSRVSVFIWEVETGMPCAWIVPEILITDRQKGRKNHA